MSAKQQKPTVLPVQIDTPLGRAYGHVSKHRFYERDDDFKHCMDCGWNDYLRPSPCVGRRLTSKEYDALVEHKEEPKCGA